jgi:hypothetical protein
MSMLTGAALLTLSENARPNQLDEKAQVEVRRWQAERQLLDTLRDLDKCVRPQGPLGKATTPEKLRHLVESILATMLTRKSWLTLFSITWDGLHKLSASINSF